VPDDFGNLPKPEDDDSERVIWRCERCSIKNTRDDAKELRYCPRTNCRGRMLCITPELLVEARAKALAKRTNSKEKTRLKKLGTSHHDLVLAAIHRLTGDDYRAEAGATESAVVVSAWKTDPNIFGLVGFAQQYPDNRRVYITYCGSKGLIHLGLVERIRGRRVRLTAAGMKRAQEIVGSMKRSA